MLDPTYQEEGGREGGREGASKVIKGEGERERERESERRKLTTAGGRLNRGCGGQSESEPGLNPNLAKIKKEVSESR